MKTWLFWVLLAVALLFQATLTTLPIALILLLVAYVVVREPWILFAGVIVGALLDIVSVHTLGQTSIFFILFLFSAFLYERKFEIRTLPFVFLWVSLGNALYIWINGYGNVMSQAIVGGWLAMGLFLLFQRLIPEESKPDLRYR